MANFLAKDAAGSTQEFKANGTGSSGDPFISNHVLADGDNVALGAKADSSASSDTGTFSLIALFKRLLSKITTQLPAALTGSGNLKVSLAESTATQAVTQSGTWTVQPGNTANTTAWLVSLAPATSGGLSIYRSLDANATGANVKSSAGQVYGWYLYNNATATRYVKLYDKATAPTVGTDTPVLTIALPAGAAANVNYANGIAFSLGIGIGATTAIADNSTAAPSTNDVVVNVVYK